jgi:chemotaxis protein CheD
LGGLNQKLESRTEADGSICISMGQFTIRKDPATLVCPGLGSCVGIIAFDRGIGMTGVAVIMLPESIGGKSEHPGRFANLALPNLIEQMVAQGADRTRIRCAIAGGAQAFKSSGHLPEHLDIGTRNAKAVQMILENMELPCVGAAVGGELARTLTFDPATGAVRVRTALAGDRLICNLGEE